VSAPAPLYGLILAGGASTRMQRDKAALPYQGKTQLDRAFELAQRHVAKVFVSVRSSQITEPTRAHRPLIVDSVDGGGPIVGIRSALAAHPGAAWLVLACDLPFPDRRRHRTAHRRARSRRPGHGVSQRPRRPARTALRHLGTRGRRRHCRLLRERRHLPAQISAHSPGEAHRAARPARAGQHQHARGIRIRPKHARQGARSRASASATSTRPGAEPYLRDQPRAAPGRRPVQLTIQYFALLREQAGRSEETVQTSAATPADLFAELNARYGFTLSREQLKVAVNSRIRRMVASVARGRCVVFIPPVAGG
jgi:molybdopterin-guanine dinucleotide biosynthesis protein A